MKPALAALLLAAAPAALAAPPAKHLLVVCSPGSPGTTAEAQPTMDAFAAALSARAGVPVAAVYDETEEAGVSRLRAKDADLALVSLPFFLKHERDLALHARLQAVQKGRPELERWTLVAKKGRVTGPAALDGYTIPSNAGFAPAFVRGPALGGFGPLPATARVTSSTAVLSSLRRAAAGEKVAVLLDGAQEAALPTLPFAAELEAVARSAPLPSGLVVTVGNRLPARSWSALEGALRGLPSDPSGAAALDAIQTTRFAPLDEKALAAARRAFAEAAR
ncbi:phosphate/phosphite/phosphonate ABC transporter substrate-binding protein [Anaeromyxobacter paludicola]|uniref:Phosphate/phosphite/phosphonate ABC transporter substrate-binding protein n=1 Tax=Anaeromyxobacter paludicola TaxID=2918171 RepID=A0ABN6N9B0_9BACT|nr:phosphate/phosphite/phosphonate ABC transporter substrate-binding protein [Anaeromyxobacter paludicola]BDG08956.1 hypothetical protein AMPC_20690 [Anaeromyxobacter paludicola]